MPLLILVADDDPGICLAVKDYLEMSGYSVVAACDGQDALEKLESYRPHLLVADIKMPRKDGYDLVRHVRQRPEFRLLPVIFLTQRGSTTERIEGYRAGCDLYLPKPFEMEELGAVIRNLLERSQAMQSEWRFENDGVGSDRAAAEKAKAALEEELELTQREREVLELLSSGRSNVEIGQKLFLSPRTVEKYVSRLLRKTKTSNRAELIRFSLVHHLVE